MRNRIVLIILALITVTTLTVGTDAAQEPSTQARKIAVTAKKFEFDVPRIEVKAGETVELTLNSVDTKHGFECKDLAIKKVTFEPDKPATVTFTATKPGTYEYKCADFCGRGHGKMKGQIIVTP
jgi:cytochrome c oxidase subunit II